MTSLPPNKRPTNLVFQRPTLFPHLDVFANVAFGLSVARVDKAQQRHRVAEALALVRLEGYEKRRSHELSGGQMQRVSLARALVNRPAVLLLDEPLSALDLKIRLEMEVELRRVHRETGATFVYVTHDQREAMALSDRLVVMNEGHVEQVDVPTEVYRSQRGTGPAWLVLRPEAVRVAGSGANGVPDALTGVVRDVAFRGTGFTYRIELPALGVHVKAETRAAVTPHAVDDPVVVEWDRDACWLLARDASEIEPPPPPVQAEPDLETAREPGA